MEIKDFLVSGGVVEVTRNGRTELGLCMSDSSVQLPNLRISYDDFEENDIEVVRTLDSSFNLVYVNLN